MSEELSLYKCNICGNIVQVVEDGGGVLVCCGEDMEKLEAKTNDEFAEKHVPVIEFDTDGQERMVKIIIGEVEHPMQQEHYIQFIEAISKDGVYLKRKILHPGEKPELHFPCNCEEMIVRAYCNVHGLWSKTI